MTVFDVLESEVRIYCREFPVVFSKGRGSLLFDEDGRAYIDFFSGAGALNYGHNNPRLKRRLLEYLEEDGITHGLDLATSAKREFLEQFDRIILQPRSLRFKIQFCGPTGANAVEAALKLSRKATGRHNVVFFMNAFHGLSTGALAVTGSKSKRAGAGLPLAFGMPMPFDGDLGPDIDTLDVLETLLENPSSGLDTPAAVIVETVQAEGGVKIARDAWLRRLADITRRHGVVLILDDIQVGCGRTGPFFSFEPSGIVPDMICLSKSISGYGLPMSLLLIRPDLDVWRPGEHTGTFRGNNLAFVTASEALSYWEDDEFSEEVKRKGTLARNLLLKISETYPEARAWVRGRGLIQALGFDIPGFAERVSKIAFTYGLVIETAGPRSEVMKLLPPLTISDTELTEGIERIGQGIGDVISDERKLAGIASEVGA